MEGVGASFESPQLRTMVEELLKEIKKNNELTEKNNKILDESNHASSRYNKTMLLLTCVIILFGIFQLLVQVFKI